jgi:hypothetical protein
MSPYDGPPMTLGNAAAARVRLIVWCLDCRHQVEPNPAAMAERYGAEMSVPDCTSGSSAASAAAGGSISSSPANGAPHRSRRRGCRSCVSAECAAGLDRRGKQLHLETSPSRAPVSSRTKRFYTQKASDGKTRTPVGHGSRQEIKYSARARF